MNCEIILQRNDFNIYDLEIAREILMGNKKEGYKSITDFDFIVVFIATHGNEKDQI